jgi:hypothetical protein
LGRKDTEHESLPASGNVQLVAENVPSPPEKDTFPEGRTAVPPSLSDTVAVQEVSALTGTLAGTHDTLVELLLNVAVTVSVPEEPP